MATATYTTDLAFINDGTNDSDMTAGTDGELTSPYHQGGTRSINEGDYFIQAAGCLAAALSSSKSGFVFSLVWDAGSNKNSTFAAGDVLMVWQVLLAGNAMATTANNGLNIVVATDLSNADIHTVGGNDSGRNPYGGWQNFAVDPTRTPETAHGSGAGTNWRWFGSAVNTLVAITKGSPNAIDAIRRGRGQLEVLEGFTVAEGTFAGMATANDAQSARWGLFSLQNGSYLYKGLMSLGSATTAVKFTDSNKNIVIDDSIAAQSTFNEIEIDHASSVVSWTNISFSSLGTTSPGTFEMLADATVTMTGCSFNNMDTFIFDSNATIDACTFNTCGIITAGGGSLANSKILTSTAGTDIGAVLCDGTYTDTTFDGMTFSKGSNAHHAIDFSTSVTSNLTLRNCNFDGFGSTDDSNDSTVRFLATSGSLTLSLVGCKVDGVAATTGNFSVDDAVGSLTVTLSIDPVALDIHVDDNEGNNLVGARVYVAASSGAGDLPYNDSVTGITRSGTVATVDMTAHGMNVGEYVNLDGITGDKTADNWGAHEILTSADVDTFTYATADSGDTTYSGTITATGVLIDDVTDSNGDISASRTLAASQPIEGVVRKSSSGATRFKSFTLGGTVDNANGLTINVRMILDE